MIDSNFVWKNKCQSLICRLLYENNKQHLIAICKMANGSACDGKHNLIFFLFIDYRSLISIGTVEYFLCKFFFFKFLAYINRFIFLLHLFFWSFLIVADGNRTWFLRLEIHIFSLSLSLYLSYTHSLSLKTKGKNLKFIQLKIIENNNFE